MSFSKATALELCALNEQAYSLATTGHATLPDGFTAPVAIRMPPTARPFLLRNDPLDIWGYATSKDDHLYLVFRGTQITSGIDFFQEWAEDALSLPPATFGTGLVHLGFYDAYMSLWQPIKNAAKELNLDPSGCIITGHSLGAAIATLCWAEYPTSNLMTFGCPRVGNPDFAKALWDGQTVRVVNEHDIVPDVGTDPPFRHGGVPQSVKGSWNLLDVKVAHSLSSYAAGLNGLQEKT